MEVVAVSKEREKDVDKEVRGRPVTLKDHTEAPRRTCLSGLRTIYFHGRDNRFQTRLG